MIKIFSYTFFVYIFCIHDKHLLHMDLTIFKCLVNIFKCFYSVFCVIYLYIFRFLSILKNKAKNENRKCRDNMKKVVVASQLLGQPIICVVYASPLCVLCVDMYYGSPQSFLCSCVGQPILFGFFLLLTR